MTIGPGRPLRCGASPWRQWSSFGVRTTGGGYKLSSECIMLKLIGLPPTRNLTCRSYSWLSDSDPECVARHDHQFDSLAHFLIKRYQTGSSWPKLKMQIGDKLGGVLADLQKAARERDRGLSTLLCPPPRLNRDTCTGRSPLQPVQNSKNSSPAVAVVKSFV